MLKDEKKQNLNIDEILNKVFTPSKYGYSADEVDEFLDLVINDYLYFNEAIEKLNKNIAEIKVKKEKLESTNKQLEIELEKYKNRFDGIKVDSSVSKENINLLKRIDKLEKFIYGKGYDANKI